MSVELICTTCGAEFYSGIFNLQEYEHPKTGEATCEECLEDFDDSLNETIADGSGCTEIWEKMSEMRDE